MDKGAHFYKTDFQIHSPRDDNWTGRKPVEDGERLAFARTFINKCRELGIQAVAITDHHDVCFVKYFQVAAQEDAPSLEEPSWDAIILAPKKQNPIVYPGIEVSLQLPCQCIVLLDADSDFTVQAKLLEAIGIGNTHPDTEKTGPQVIKLSHTLPGLHEAISDYAHGVLKGRFIILPHVGDGGHKTIMRAGFNTHYAQMPCVGGYIEKDWGDHRSQHIFEGLDHNYRNKAIGIFQTTDSRRDDFAELGKRNTWVKFSSPTAEALRQACLAKGSRIRQEPPKLPAIFIEKIEVSDSQFLGNIDLNLNPQYNALIGGRGTGKTSLLEYIRHAMQDQPNFGGSDVPDGISHKRRSIIETVVRCNAIIKVHWCNNDVKYVVCFNTQDSKLTLSIEGGEHKEVSPEELRKLLPLQAYSQKQLSSVGTRISELQRFIEQPIQEQLGCCNQNIEQKRTDIRSIYQTLCEYKKNQKKLRATHTKLISMTSQIAAIKKTLSKMSDDLQKSLNEHPLRLKEKDAAESLWDDLKKVSSSFSELTELLKTLPEQITVEDDSPQKAQILDVFQKSQRLCNETYSKVTELGGDWEDGKEAIRSDLRTWNDQHKKHLEQYTKAQEDSKESKDKLRSINNLQNQAGQLQSTIAQLKNAISKQEYVVSDFDKAWGSWITEHSERADLLEHACDELTDKSGGEIKAEISRGADIEQPLEKLKGILSGSSITSNHWDELKKFLEDHSESPAKAWMEVMEQLRVLAEIDENDITEGAKVPGISSWRLTENMRKRIIQKLVPQNWLELALISLKDKPIFFYCPNPTQKISFEDASAGQQATALLKVLLKETTGPLLIDQPEDDLDNLVIWEIAEEIWAAKEKRQLIFSSHNANLVVNGDAELVIQFNYCDRTDKTKGTIQNQGAIDVHKVRKAITEVMEGGAKAFKLRKEKYGF